jgi:hypothetical protein
MATINHKTYNEATETFKDFSVYDGKETLIFKVDGADQTVYASNIIGSGIIKTSDNGPLSATAKYLSDGLGNNSALALSTSLVGVGATTLFTKMSIANSLSATSIGTNYNAGILNIQNTNTTNGNLSLIGFQDASASINLAAVGAINTVHSASPNSVVGELGFYTKASGGGYVTERMRITSTGRVGIGTTADYSFNDDAKLAVANTSGNSTISIVSGTGSTGYLAFADGTSGTDRYTGSINYLHASDAMTFNTNAGNERMRITSAGYVGIGTSSPTATLDVGGEIKLSSDLYMGNNRFLRFERNSGSTSIQTLGIPTGTDDVRLLTTGDFNLVTGSLSNLLTVKQAGNVGIGTASPAYRFNVVTDAIAGAQNLAAIDRTAQNFVTFTNPQFSTDASMGLMLRVFPQSDARQGAGILASGGAANGETDLNLFVSSGTVSSTSYSALTLKGGSGNVGIGETSPAQKLHVSISETTAYAASSASLIQPDGGSNLLIQNTGESGFASLRFAALNASNAVGYFGFNNNTANVGGSFIFGQRTGATSYAEQMRITDTGNVGIGTSAPTNLLHLAGASATPSLRLGSVSEGFYWDIGRENATTGDFVFNNASGGASTERVRILAGGGLTFNGDTAAANALDDYEEGAWTMGISFGGAAVGVTYGANAGSYTKIGRQVTVCGFIGLSSKGSSTGVAAITGLPFTIGSANSNYCAASVRLTTITFANQFQAYGAINTTTIPLEEITEAGTLTGISNGDFANNSEILLSLTYFV